MRVSQWRRNGHWFAIIMVLAAIGWLAARAGAQITCQNDLCDQDSCWNCYVKDSQGNYNWQCFDIWGDTNRESSSQCCCPFPELNNGTNVFNTDGGDYNNACLATKPMVSVYRGKALCSNACDVVVNNNNNQYPGSKCADDPFAVLVEIDQGVCSQVTGGTG